MGLATTPKPRPPYFRDGKPRPVLRGRIMQVLLWPWPLTLLVHLVITNYLFPRTEMVIPRALTALATTANVVLSDIYHNGDTRGHTVADEIRWLRCDFVGISAVLSATFALWSAHFRWADPYPQLTAAMACATVLVAIVAFALFETDSAFTCFRDPQHARPGPRTQLGETLIKALLGAQFCFGFGVGMVWRALGTACAPYTAIWFTYVPGFVAYVIDRPADGRWWGAHDLFHVCVIAGHVVSAVCDAVDLVTECAAR